MEVHLARIDMIVVGAPGRGCDVLSHDYEQRLKKWVRLTVHEVRGARLKLGHDVVLREEGQRMGVLLDRLTGQRAHTATGAPHIIALDIAGTQVSSTDIAKSWLSRAHIIVLIGGACGLAPDMLDRAATRASFGRITLPHQLARVVAVEQLYRAHKIARGEPYHH